MINILSSIQDKRLEFAPNKLRKTFGKTNNKSNTKKFSVKKSKIIVIHTCYNVHVIMMCPTSACINSFNGKSCGTTRKTKLEELSSVSEGLALFREGFRGGFIVWPIIMPRGIWPMCSQLNISSLAYRTRFVFFFSSNVKIISKSKQQKITQHL